jgi:hypothetical protein
MCMCVCILGENFWAYMTSCSVDMCVMCVCVCDTWLCVCTLGGELLGVHDKLLVSVDVHACVMCVFVDLVRTSGRA